MLSPVVFGWTVVALAAVSAGVALFAMWLEANRKRAEEERLARMIEEARRRERFEEEFRSISRISEAERTGVRNNPYRKKSSAEKAESPTNPYKTNNDAWPTDTHRLDGQHNYSPLRLVTDE